MRKCQSLVWLNFISGLQFIKEQNIVNKSTSVFNSQNYDKSSNLKNIYLRMGVCLDAQGGPRIVLF